MDELTRLIKNTYVNEIYTDKPHGLSNNNIEILAQAIRNIYVRKPTVGKLMKLIPEIYCDVPIDAKEVKCLKIDDHLYLLQQENGKRLAQAIVDMLKKK